MRSVLAAFVAVATLVSTASSSPLAFIPAAVVDSNTLIISIGSIHGNQGNTYYTVVDKTSTSSNSHQNGTSPPATLVNTFSGAVGPNSTIYIVGATLKNDEGQDAAFLSYDVQADKWTTLPPLTSEDEPASVVIVGTQLLAIGSFPFDRQNKQRVGNGPGVYAFDLSAQSKQTWVEIPTPLPGSGVASICAVSHNDAVYYLVESGGLFRSSDGAQTWTHLASASGPRTFAGCAALDDVIVVAGGVGHDNFTMTAEVYDISKNEWHDTQPMSKVRLNAKAVVVPIDDGKSQVVVCGGYGANNTTLSYKDCEQLDLDTNQWDPAGFTLDEQFLGSLFGLFVVTQN